MSGHVVATHIWPAELPTPIRVDELVIDWGGPVGDRHYGETMISDSRQKAAFEPGTVIRNHRQLSLVDVADLARIADALGIDAVAPGLIADNICTEGVLDLTSLPRMTRMVFSSGVVIMLGGENFPCTIAGALVRSVHGTTPSAFPKAAIGLRGVTAWVERPGIVSSGDEITLVIP